MQRRAMLVVLLIAMTRLTFGQETNPGSVRPDYSRAVIFFHRLQDALRRNDREEISRIVQYPLRARLHGKLAKIRTRQEFVKDFDLLFDSSVRCVILHATDKSVWGNWRGFTVDGGAIWFDDISPPGTNDDTDAPDFWTKGKFFIITMNNDSFYDCKAAK